MAEDDRTWQGFIRQRRNLLIVSLLLTFVQFAGLEIKPDQEVAGIGVVLHNPIAIYYALVIGWAYWLIRYIQYHNDLGEKGFRLTYLQRMQELVKRIALRQVKRTGLPHFKSPPPWKYRLDLEHANASRQSKRRYLINFVMVARSIDDDATKHPVFQEQKDYEINQWAPLARAHVRAWMYVIFRTHLFSEYILPYIVAAIPVVYFFLYDSS